MSLMSRHEISERAIAFAKRFEGETSERGEAQTFWNEFLGVFGVDRKRVARFELNKQRLGKKHGFVDMFWPGKLIVEHKSEGEDLDSAALQAEDYFVSLKEREHPRYIIVSDFARIRLYDLEKSGDERQFECTLKELPKKVGKFLFIAGYDEVKPRDEDPVNKSAVKAVQRLYEKLAANNYEDHALKLILVRLVYCFFADDTLIWEPDRFRYYLDNFTAEDGSDVGPKLEQIFQLLNTPKEKRQSTLSEDFAFLPFVDGHLFAERLPLPAFDAKMREVLLDCAGYDWSKVSPAIFGSMFQSIMDKKARHDLGAHYTSEKNILKVVDSLFLDDLKAEFEDIKGNKRRLQDFQGKLASLHFLDPACGCGNFLVVAYRELRWLELEVIKLLHKEGQGRMLNLASLSKVNVDQMAGIEIEEFPAKIAEMALWVTDHQMNRMLGDHYGQYVSRLPLTTSPNIRRGNALRMDWEELVPKEKLSFILGNPPYLGSKVMEKEQKEDMAYVFGEHGGFGNLDYVAAWYKKAADLIVGTGIECAFVSTNSITQGEQVGLLWKPLLERDISINFAHRTFKWTNEALGKAAVFCVIIGFSAQDRKDKFIYDYETPISEPHRLPVKHINPYLVDAPDIVVSSRSKPLCDVPEIGIGNQPIDDGNYLFTPKEKEEFLEKEPGAKKYFRRWLGADEFINGWERWCLWLGDAPPDELRRMPYALERIGAVKRFRSSSKRGSTLKLSETPTRFQVENFPSANYLLIPSVSSESRRYIPIGFLDPSTFASNLVLIVPDATLYHFGILQSEMHMAWMRAVCGRLESRYRYSKDIVYNNFPWPEEASVANKRAVEEAAQAVLEARAKFPKSSLADLYDPNTMPPALLAAHKALDRAVDKCYGRKKFETEMERVQFLFERYRELVSRQSSMSSAAKKRKKS